MSHRLYYGYRLSSLLRIRKKCLPQLTQLGAEQSRAFASPPRVPSTCNGRKRPRSEGETGIEKQSGALEQPKAPAVTVEQAQREKIGTSFSRDSASLPVQHWQAIIDKHEAKPEHPCVATYEVIEAYASLGELEVAVKLLEDKFAAYAEAPVSYAKIQGGRAFEYEAAATLRAEANIRQSTQETRAFIGLIYCCVRARQHALAARVVKCMMDHDMRPRLANHWTTALTALTLSGRLELLVPFLTHGSLHSPAPQSEGGREDEDVVSLVMLRALQALQAAVDRPSAVEEAMQLVVDRRRRQWRLTRQCALVAMDICQRHADPAQAERLLHMAIKNGLTPDAAMGAALVGAYAIAGDMKGAVGAVEQMRRRHVQPSISTLAAIMRGFKQKRDAEGALAFLRSMESVLEGGDTQEGTSKGAASASKRDQAAARRAHTEAEHVLVRRLASTCALSHRLDVAREVISSVLPEGHMRTLLQHEVTLLAGEASSQEVLDIFKDMGDARYTPSIEAYAAACKVVKDTPSRIKLIAARPPGVDYSSFFPYSVWLMDLGRSDSHEESLELLGVLEREKLPVSLHGYTAVMTACSRAGKWEESERIVQTLRRRQGLQPDTYVYNALLLGHAQTAQWERALATLSDMAVHGVPPDIISLNTTMTACDRAGQWKACVRLFLRCLREGKAAASAAAQSPRPRAPASPPDLPALPFPDGLSLHLCVSACLHADRFSEAARLLVRPLGITPLLSTYSVTLGAMASNAPEHLEPTPVDVLHSMRMWGLIPTPRRFENVLRWCVRGRWWQQALQVMQEALETQPSPYWAGLMCSQAVTVCNAAGRREEAQQLLASLPPDVVAWYRVRVVRDMLNGDRDDQARSFLNELIAGVDAGQPWEKQLERCLKHYRHRGRSEVVQRLAEADGASDRVRQVALQVSEVGEHGDSFEEEEEEQEEEEQEEEREEEPKPQSG